MFITGSLLFFESADIDLVSKLSQNALNIHDYFIGQAVLSVYLGVMVAAIIYLKKKILQTHIYSIILR